MTEIPRKPTFPLHMIQKLLAKIQSEVNDDVIPVSTGIYSYQKLKNKLQAIPKPEIENYEDKIFFQVIQDRLSPPDKTGEKCPSCEQQYNMKKNPALMCNFCAFWCCNNCMPVRKRPHPLSKDANGKRYNICQRCDTKFLNLQLGHSYVQNRTLLQQAIAKTSQELQSITNECKQYQQIVTKSKQTFEKNKFKIAQLKKEKLGLNKDIKTKLPQQIRINDLKTEQLKQRFVQVHLQHQQWLEMSQSRKRIWQDEKQKQRIQRQQRQRLQQEKENLRRQKQREQQQQAQRMQREKRQAEQRQRESQQHKIRKLKKAPSLSQNLTLNMSLSYNSQSKIENIKPQEQMKVQTSKIQEQASIQKQARKMSIEIQSIDAKKDLKKLNEQQEKKETPVQQTMRQSEVFREYFTEANQQQGQEQDEYFSHKYKTSNKKIFDESAQKQKQQQKQKQKTQNQKEVYVSNFIFNEKIIDKLKPHQNTWHYQQKQRKKSQNIENLEEPQFKFDQKKQQQSQLEQKEVEVIEPVTKKEKIEQPKNNQEQDNHLSFVDEWYVNKQNKIPQNQSTLSSVLNNQSLYQRPYISSKKMKTPQELQEECTKSTSQLDEEQLQVARYSLLKAARDTAVQQRQKNKIYQRSVHEVVPYDQEQETVGEVKKCQCSIY